MRFVFISGHRVARDEWPVWLEAAVLAAGRGQEVAVVLPEVGLRREIDARVAELGARILFCPLKPVLGWFEWFRIGRANRVGWWQGRFAEPPDAVCLAADGWREPLPGCLEWLKEQRIGYVEAVSPPRTDGGGRRTEEELEPQITRNDTKGEEAGPCLDKPSGAAFSNPSPRELARNSENTPRTRSASGFASLLATRHALPATAPEAIERQVRELLEEMCRVAVREGGSRYHKWSGLPFFWDEEWI